MQRMWLLAESASLTYEQLLEERALEAVESLERLYAIATGVEGQETRELYGLQWSQHGC